MRERREYGMVMTWTCVVIKHKTSDKRDGGRAEHNGARFECLHCLHTNLIPRGDVLRQHYKVEEWRIECPSPLAILITFCSLFLPLLVHPPPPAAVDRRGRCRTQTCRSPFYPTRNTISPSPTTTTTTTTTTDRSIPGQKQGPVVLEVHPLPGFWEMWMPSMRTPPGILRAK